MPWLSDSGAPRWSGAALRAYLTCLRRAGRGRAEPGPLSRRAASGLCALRESPEQCERDAERARPMGVTSLRSLIRRSACAARAAGAPVTARPSRRRRGDAPPAPRTSRRCEPTVGPRRPATGMGGGPGRPLPPAVLTESLGSWSATPNFSPSGSQTSFISLHF